MGRLFFVLIFIPCCFNESNSVQIKPGVYFVTIYDQEYECTDGTHQSEMADQTDEWTITHEGSQWKLHLSDDVMMDCQPNGPDLACSGEGSITIPDICTYPFAVNIDLNDTDVGFIGNIVWLYRFVVCTNGNTGNCTMTANIDGILQ